MDILNNETAAELGQIIKNTLIEAFKNETIKKDFEEWCKSPMGQRYAKREVS